ncbi:MAG: NUDIX hydrolase [Gemmatimonadaceae bacterium]
MRGTHSGTVDVVLCTPHGRQLGVLFVRDAGTRGRDRWCLPSAPAGTSLDDTAARVAFRASGARAAWIGQAGAFASGKRGAAAAITVAYVAVMPVAPHAPPAGSRWFPSATLPPLGAAQKAIVHAAFGQLRDRLDRAPVAFKLLAPTFTLSELQTVYEVLLGRRLHKASFRRALHAAFLVKPTDEWRSEGRGRPAQLFRYAPRKRLGQRGGVRFEMLGD